MPDGHRLRGTNFTSSYTLNYSNCLSPILSKATVPASYRRSPKMLNTGVTVHAIILIEAIIVGQIESIIVAPII